MTAVTTPALAERRPDRRYSRLLRARRSLRPSLVGLVALLYAAILLFDLASLLTSPRLSLTLQAKAHGDPRIAWLLPGGNLWEVGMRPGDRILRLDGHTPASISGTWEGRQATVLGSGGRVVTANAATARHTATAWPLLLLSPWFFLFGVLVFLRARPPVVGRNAFALFSLAAFALALGPAADAARFTLAVVAERVVVPFFAASFAGFFLVFPRMLSLPRSARGILYLPAFVAAALSTYATVIPSAYDRVDALWVTLLVLYLCLGAAIAVRGWATVIEPDVRLGLRIIGVGTLLSVLPFVVLSLGPSLLGWPVPVRPEQAVLGIALLPVSFTYAILRYEVVAVHLAQRWLLRLAIWGGLVCVYVAAIFLVFRLLNLSVFDQRDLILEAVALSLAVSISFPPCYGWLRRTVDGHVFHDAYDYRSWLHEISQGLSLGTGLETLGRSLPSTLTQLMHLEFVSLLVYEGDQLRRLGGDGSEYPCLAADVRTLLEEARAPLGSHLLDRGSGAILLVPLHAEGTVAGCLCLGPKRNGEPFSGEDMTLLRTLSGHVAATIRNAQLAEELRAQVVVLDALNVRLQHAQEEERARLVAELHDEPLQTALHLERCIAADGVGRAASAQHLLLSTRIIDQLRALCMAVRPAALEELGVGAALELLAADLEQHTGVPIALEADSDIGDLPLSASAELVLYRAAQEALNNALKHAHPSELRISLENRGGCVELAVLDDGSGFDAAASSRGHLAAGHLGLAGLRQRVERSGGYLDVVSSVGCGTCVRIRLPIEGGV